jgi:contact-dependent growth inhibition (CDI) system CdiI-like immunity protein
MNGTIDIDTVAHPGADYPALTQLLGGYFHQDWREDHASPEAAIEAFIRDTSAQTITAAAADIDRLLRAGFDAAALAELLTDGFDCNYIAETDGLSSAAWLTQIRDSLRAAASERG